MAMNAITCPACGVEEINHEEIPLHEIGEFVCDNHECRTRIVFGKIMPRIVVEPFIDERHYRWTRIRWQDPVTKQDLYVQDLDPKLVLRLTNNLLSMVTP